jgi:DinB superfamily
MKKALLLACALVCFTSASFGQALTAADREKGVKYLEQTRDAVIAATQGLSEAQWKFKAAPDKWSVAETLEHIALGEDYLFGFEKNKVMTSPPGPADRDIAKLDALVLAMVPDRSNKRQAPPPLVPTGKWTPAEALDHFLKSRAVTIEYMKTTKDLREHVSESPLGLLDGYEWLLFIGAHSERHTKQILEVKANPDFPKS